MTRPPLPVAETVPDFEALGLVAFTTQRQAGSFALHGDEPSAVVWDRWIALAQALGAERLISAHQVHGVKVLSHTGEWSGILRASEADGHMAWSGSTAMAVTLADCIPVFIGHPAGVGAIVHSGWKGTAAGITQVAITALDAVGYRAADLRVHAGPGICGRCYEVGPEVYSRLTGRRAEQPTPVDLRALIADCARAAGVRAVSVSTSCTRCDNDRFYSHRCGDLGRQLGVLRTR
ncbi:MAG: polyphenol oxidase family protein [Gemmatimonadaceae bacterium]|nr:polyphenol oxidase family protein [Gemmatimonadaceae bacterium]